MLTNLYPYLFKPIYKDYLWGGDDLRRLLKRRETPRPCAESWEVAQRPEGMSVVENGPLAGKTLEELIETVGSTEILGEDALREGKNPCRFPLLIKLIDAQQLLSVQVHPNEKTAHLRGGEPKSEMWYVLHCDPDAYVYIGLKEGIDAAGCMAALKTGEAEAVLNRVPIEPGDVIDVPAGAIHAIGPGALLLEVQQNSNTTYRLHDWNRTDASGAARELHIQEGLEAIDPASPWRLERVRPIKQREGYLAEKLIQSPHFNLDKLSIQTEVTLQSRASFQVFFAEKGSVEITIGRQKTLLKKGRSALIPAAAQSITICPEGPNKAPKKKESSPAAELIRICLP